MPRIQQKPNVRTDLRWALFTYTDKERGVSFECSFDHSRYKPCGARSLYGLLETRITNTSSCKSHCANAHAKHSGRRGAAPHTHNVLRGVGRLLNLGRHTFQVRAHSRSGRVSYAASYTWMIMTRAQLEVLERSQSSNGGSGQGTGGSGSGSNVGGSGGSGTGGSGGGEGSGYGGGGGGGAPIGRTRGFVISGQPEGTLAPGGPALAIPLTMFNPNPVPVYVTALAVSVPASPEGCSAAENLRLVQSDVSAEKPVKLPADSAVTLPAQEVSAPTIALLNLPVDQSACQNASFSLVYTGSGHS
jgi:hypothetical protein